MYAEMEQRAITLSLVGKEGDHTKAQASRSKGIGNQPCILLVTQVSTKLPTLFPGHNRCVLDKRNSPVIQRVGLEILVLASLLRTVHSWEC